MQIPSNTQLYETPISTFWWDQSGILCGVSKKHERTVEHYSKLMELYQKLIKGNEKLCLMADANESMPLNKEIREYISEEMPKYIKAHAIITTAPLGGTLANVFLTISSTGFPVRLFSNEMDAKEWLMEYL